MSPKNVTTTKPRTSSRARSAKREGRAPTTIDAPVGKRRFPWDDRPLSTPFYRRFTAILREAFDDGLWMIVCAQPGDGKSTAIEGFVAQHPRCESVGATEVPIFYTRVPQGAKTALALMLAFADGLGRVPTGQKGARLQRWLFDTAVTSQVRLIIIDDAHELSMAQLNWLREFTGSLAVAGVRPGLILSAAIASDETRRLPLWAMLDTLDLRSRARTLTGAEEQRMLTAWQFSRRLDGERPLVHVPAHTESEVGEILKGWQRRYSPFWPALNLTRWTKSLTEWCLDGRIDIADFKLVCINPLGLIVRSALDDEMRAGGDGSGDDFGVRLRSAAIRQMSRGTTFATVNGDPLKGDLRYIDFDADPEPEDQSDAA